MSSLAFAAGRIISFGTTGNQKYRAKPTVVDGIRFASKKEARRWTQLQLLERTGTIRDIKRQVTFRLDVNGQFICRYITDFVYEERHGDEWRQVVEDVKGYATKEYRLKKKLMKACLGIEIRET